MHSHEGLQEQLLMAAPLIIHDRQKPSQREFVVELSDFSFTPPEEIYAQLRKRTAMAGNGADEDGRRRQARSQRRQI